MSQSIPLEGLSIQVADKLPGLQQVTAIALPIPANAIPSNLVWLIDPLEQSIATVDPDTGVITILSSGGDHFTLYVRNYSYSASIRIDVIPSLVSVELVNPPSELYIGYSVPLEYALTWSNGTTGKTNGTIIPSLSFTSSNPLVLSVDSSGNVLALKTSSTEKTITLTINAGISFTTTASILVVNRPNTLSVSVTRASIFYTDVYVGKSTQVYPVIFPLGVSVNIVWSVSDSAVAYIDPVSGIVTGLSNGSFTITALITDTTASPFTRTAITDSIVCTTLIHSMILEPTSIMGLQIEQDYTATLSEALSIYPETASANEPTWTSSNPGVATVVADYVADTLTITGVKNGFTTITVQSADINAATATMVVGVENGLASITATIPTTIFIGKSTQATVSGFASDGTTPGYFSGAKWKSSDTSVLTVSSKGLISGISVGNANITVQVGGPAGSATSYDYPVSVTQPVQTILVSPAKIFLTINATGDTKGTIVTSSQLITATVSPSSLSSTPVSWESSSPGTVSVDTEGNITGHDTGQAIITVRALDGSNVFATVPVSVGIPIRSIELFLDSTTLSMGTPMLAIAKIHPLITTTDYRLWKVDAGSESIIKITDDGLIIPLRGTGPSEYARFTVYCRNQFGTGVIVSQQSAQLTVRNSIQGVSLPPYIITNLGKSITISPYIFPTTLAGSVLNWKIFSLSVATITGSTNSTYTGTSLALTINNAGTCRVTATTTDGTNLTGTGYIYASDLPFQLVQTIAGSSTGSQNGNGLDAQFNNPNGIAIDSSGNIYIADTMNDAVRMIDPSRNVTTVATVTKPFSIVLDSSGNIYTLSNYDTAIYITAPGLTPVAFSGQTQSDPDAQFNRPYGLCIDSSGNMYVADSGNNRICLVTPDGNVTTYAGSTVGYLDGTALDAQFNNPVGVDIDSAGNVYVADRGNNVIRIIYESGEVSTLAGQVGIFGQSIDGNGTDAAFGEVVSVTVDPFYKNIYVADSSNRSIRRIDKSTNVTTLTGSSLGYKDGLLSDALFNNIVCVKSDSLGNIYIIDSDYIRGVLVFNDPPTPVVFTSSVKSSIDFTASWSGAIGVLSYKYELISPDATNTISPYIDNGLMFKNVSIVGLSPATEYTLRITAINPNGLATPSESTFTTLSDGSVSQFTTTFAGSIKGDADGTGSTVQFNYIISIAIGPSGNIYVVDINSGSGASIRKLSSDGTSSLLAGGPQGSYGFVNGQGASVRFSSPSGIVADSNENLYVLDSGNNAIRKVEQNGNVTTLYSFDILGVGVPNICGIACDKNNNIYVSSLMSNIIYKIDSPNNRSVYYTMPTASVNPRIVFDANGYMLVTVDDCMIYRINSDSTLGLIAGSTKGYADGQGSLAAFQLILSMTVDSFGNIYVVDKGNNAIRKIDSTNNVTTLNSNRLIGFADGTASISKFNAPFYITVDSFNNVYIADTGNYKIRKINTVLSVPSPITAITYTTPSYSQLQITWTGGTYSTRFTYSLNNGTSTVIPSIDNGILSKTATFNDLIDSKQYTVIVTGFNEYGSVVSSPVTLRMPANPVAKQYIVFTLYQEVNSDVPYFSSSQPIASDMKVDSYGNVYFIKLHSVYRWNATTQAIELFAGSGGNASGLVDGNGNSARFSNPKGLVILGNSIYVADTNNNVIRQILPSGDVTTVAGSSSGIAGNQNGLATVARFNKPSYIAIDSSSNYYICDNGNFLVRKIDTNGNVTTLAGSGSAGNGTDADDGNAEPNSARFTTNLGKLTVDSNGTVYIVEGTRVRMVTSLGVVTTLYKNILNCGITCDNGDRVYLQDATHNVIKQIYANGGTPRTVAGLYDGAASYLDAMDVNAKFSFNATDGYTPCLASDPSDNLYVFDTDTNGLPNIRVLEIVNQAPTSVGTITASSVTDTGFVLTWTEGLYSRAFTFTLDGNQVTPSYNVILKTATFTGLTANTKYTVVIAGTNAYGPGPSRSIEVGVGIFSIVNVSSSELGGNGFTISWEGGTNATYYTFTLNSGSGPVTQVPQIDESLSTKTVTFNGLASQTAYTVIITASNQYVSVSSTAFSVTTLVSTMENITNLVAKFFTPVGFTLTWDGGYSIIETDTDRVFYTITIDDGESPIVYNELAYKRNGIADWLQSTTYSGLTPATTYTITLAATNLTDTVISKTTATTKPSALTPITNITSSGVGTRAFSLSWQGGDVAESYLYSLNGGSTFITPLLDLGLTSKTVFFNKLTPGTTYSVLILAVTQYESKSNSKPVTTVASTLTNVTNLTRVAGSLKPTGFTLSWEGGATASQYLYTLDFLGGVFSALSSVYGTTVKTTTLTELTPSTTYNVAIMAYTNIDSVTSSVLEITTPEASLTPVTGITQATARTPSGFTLSWSGGDANIAVQYSYVVTTVVTVAGPTFGTTVTVTPSVTTNVATKTATFSGLRSDTTYTVTITAYTDYETTSTTATGIETGSSTIGLITVTGNTMTKTSLTVIWRGAANATTFVYSLNDGTSTISVTPSSDTFVSPNNTTVISGLVPATNYILTIRGENIYGLGPAATLSFKTAGDTLQHLVSTLPQTGEYANTFYGNVMKLDSSGNIYIASSLFGTSTNSYYIVSPTNYNVSKINNNSDQVQDFVVDTLGNIFYTLVTTTSSILFKMDSGSTTSTEFAGSSTPGFQDGTGSAAKFDGLLYLTIDASNNIYGYDVHNTRIRKITSAGVVTTLAGSATPATSTNTDNGTGSGAKFSNNYQNFLTVDTSQNLYLSEASGRIRKITQAGVVTTYYDSSGSLVFSSITCDKSGNLYVLADSVESASITIVLKIESDGTPRIIAGALGQQAYIDDIDTLARFSGSSLFTCADGSGNIFVLDRDTSDMSVVRNIRRNTFTPTAITGLRYSSVTDTGFTIQWSGGNYSRTYSFTIDNVAVTPSYDAHLKTATFTGLTANTSYTAKVIGKNAYGSTTAASITVGVGVFSVTDITSSSVTGNSFVLSWSGGTNATQYSYNVKIGNQVVTPTIVTDIAEKTATFSYLRALTNYTILITASNSSVSTVSAPFIQQTDVAGSITSISGINVSSASYYEFIIVWSGGQGATQYDYYFGDSSGNNLQLATAAQIVEDDGASNMAVFNLTPGTTYTFVLGVSSADDSLLSSPFRIITGTKSKITNLQATAGTRSITLTWQGASGAIASDYSFSLYRAGSANSTNPNPNTLDLVSSTRSATFNGLTPGSSYIISVITNQEITEPNGEIKADYNSENITISTTTSTLTSLSNIQSSIKTTSFTLTWDGGATATGYIFTVTSGTTTVTPSISTNLQTKTAVFTGLTQNTAYSVSIRVYNANDSITSSPINITTAVSTLTTITGLVSSLVKTTGFKISWGGGATANEYKYSLNGGSTYVTPSTDNGVSGQNAIFTGLNPATQYTVVITALNNVESVTSSNLLVTTATSTLTAITLSFSAVTATGFTLSWTGAATATSYTYSLNGTLVTPTTDNSLTAKTVIFTGLTDGTAFTVFITGYNAVESRNSNTVTPTTGALLRVTNVQSSSITDTGFTLSWTATGATASSYAYTINDGTGAVTATPSTDNGLASRTITFTGLSNGTPYTITITGTNIYGPGPSTQIQVTTLGGIFLYGVRTVASLSGNTSINLDSSGNIYSLSSGGFGGYYKSINRISPADSYSTAIISEEYQTTSEISSVVSDSSGNIWYLQTDGTLFKFILSSSTNLYEIPGGINKFPPPIATIDSAGNLIIDSSGNLYAPTASYTQIIKITPDLTVSSYLGTTTAGDGTDADNGTETGIVLFTTDPMYLANDSSGNMYVSQGYRIRKISPGGVATTLYTSTDYMCNSITCDKLGNIYFVGNTSIIVKINPLGVATTIIGSLGENSILDAISSSARLSAPGSLHTDTYGNIYFTDGSNLRKVIRITTPPTRVYGVSNPTCLSTEIIVSWAGGENATDFVFTLNGNTVVPDSYNVATKTATFNNLTAATMYTLTIRGTNVYGQSPAFSSEVRSGGEIFQYIVSTVLTTPVTTHDYYSGQPAMCIDSQNNIYLANVYYDGHSIYKITPNYTRTLYYNFGTSIVTAMCIDSSGNIFYSDLDSASIYKLSNGVSTLFAGGTLGFQDGTGTTAQFNSITSMVIDSSNNIFVVDIYNARIRKITPGAVVTSVYGPDYGLNNIAIDPFNNIYALLNYTSIISISPLNIVENFATLPDYGLYIVCCDSAGNVYAAGGTVIIRIQSDLTVNNVGGSFGIYDYIDGMDTLSRFNNIAAVAGDSSGNIYTSELQLDSNYAFTSSSPLRKISRDTHLPTAIGTITTTSITATNFTVTWPGGQYSRDYSFTFNGSPIRTTPGVFIGDPTYQASIVMNVQVILEYLTENFTLPLSYSAGVYSVSDLLGFIQSFSNFGLFLNNSGVSATINADGYLSVSTPYPFSIIFNHATETGNWLAAPLGFNEVTSSSSETSFTYTSSSVNGVNTVISPNKIDIGSGVPYVSSYSLYSKTATITRLPRLLPYVVTVAGTNAYGTTTGSISVSTITAMTGLTASAIGPRTFTLTWQGGVGVSQYGTVQYAYSLDDGATYRIPTTNNSASTSGSKSVIFTGLLPGTTYTVRITASNTVHNIQSGTISFTTVASSLVAISNMQVSSRGSNTFTLTWDGGENSTTSGFTMNSYNGLGPVSITPTLNGNSAVFSSLNSGATYTVVYTKSTAIDTVSSTITVITRSITDITNLAAPTATIGRNYFSITWQGGVGSSQYSYNFSSGNPRVSVDNGVASQTATFSGLQPDTTYSLYIVGSNSVDSYTSSNLTVTTKPITIPSITDPTVSSVNGNGFTISWSGGTNSNQYKYFLNDVQVRPFTDNGISAQNAVFKYLFSQTTFSIYIQALNEYTSITSDTFTGTTGSSSITNITNIQLQTTTRNNTTITWSGGVGATSYVYSLDGGVTFSSDPTNYQYTLDNGLTYTGTGITDNGVSSKNAIFGTLPSTTYNIIVRAVNSSTAVNSATLTIVSGSITDITNVLISQVRQIGFTMTWEGAAGATTYTYTNMSDGTIFAIPTTQILTSGPYDITTKIAIFTGLTPGTSYYVKISASNREVFSQEYVWTSFQVTTVSNITAISADDYQTTRFAISWSFNRIPYSYQFELENGQFLTPYETAYRDGIPSWANFTGLTPGTTYTFRIKARIQYYVLPTYLLQYETIISDPVTITTRTSNITAIENLYVSAILFTGFTLSWTGATNATSYIYLVNPEDTIGSPYTGVVLTTVTSKTAVFTGLISGKTYNVIVVPVNGNGPNPLAIAAADVTTATQPYSVSTITQTGISSSEYATSTMAIDRNNNIYLASRTDTISGNSVYNIYKVVPSNNFNVSLFYNINYTSMLNSTTPIDFTALTTDTSGNIYYANTSTIYKITPGGVGSVFAGNGTQAFQNGTRTNAQFNYPYSLLMDSSSNMYVDDVGNSKIRKIDTSGNVTTLANNISAYTSLAIDLSGNVYTHQGNLIKKISKTGVVSNITTTGTFTSYFYINNDASGNIYAITDSTAIINLNTQMAIAGTNGQQGYTDDLGQFALFSSINCMASDTSGNLYVNDSYVNGGITYSSLRKIVKVTTAPSAITGVYCYNDSSISDELGIRWTGSTNTTEYEFRINGNLSIPDEYSFKNKTASFRYRGFTNNTAYTVNVKPTNGYGSGASLSASILTGLYLYGMTDPYSLLTYNGPFQGLPANGGTTLTFYFSDTGDKSYSFTLYTATGAVAATPNMTLSSYTGNTAPSNVTRNVVFSNLTEKTTYTMRTTITNSYGSNIYNSIGTTGTAQVTSIPSLSVTSISDTNAVTLSWVGGAPINNNIGVQIEYYFYFNSTNGNETFLLKRINFTDYTYNVVPNYVWPTTYTTIDLASSTTYTVYMTATDGTDTVRTPTITVRTLSSITQIVRSSSSIGPYGFTISWTGGATTSALLDTYGPTTFTYSLDGGATLVTPSTVNTSSSPYSITFTGLIPLQTYNATIVATNYLESYNSVPLAVRTLTNLTAPSTIVSSAIDATTFTLSWQGGTNATSYRYTVKIGTVTVTPTIVTNVGTKTAVFTNLSARTTYTVIVTSVNAYDAINSVTTTVATLDQIISPITNLTTTSVEAHVIAIRWFGADYAINSSYTFTAQVGGTTTSITPSSMSGGDKVAVFSSLLRNTQYTITVIATNTRNSVNASVVATTLENQVTAITSFAVTTSLTRAQYFTITWQGGLLATDYTYYLNGTSVIPASVNIAASPKTATFSQLTIGTLYNVYIRAYNIDTTVNSSTVSVTTSGPTISAITNVRTSSIKPTYMVLLWDGGLGATEYSYSLKIGTTVATTTPSSENAIFGNTATFSNLLPSTTYSIVITATNGINTVNSTSFNQMTDVDKPYDITVTNNFRNQINLSWSGPTATPTSYAYLLNNVVQTARITNGVNNGVSGKNVQIYGTPSDVPYSIIIRAIDSSGNNLNSSAYSLTTGSSSIQNITNLQATLIRGSSISISWTGVGGYGPVQYYRYSINDGVSFLTNNVTDGGPTGNTAVISGLTALTNYKIVVGAWNADDATFSDTLSVTTGQPDVTAITNVRSTNNGRNQLNLAWDGGTYATSYEYYFNDKIASQGGRLTTDNGVSAKNVQFNGLPTNTTYNILIRARNIARAQSVDSPIFTITTGGGSSIQNVTNLQTTRIKGSSINLSWTGQLGNPNIQYYRYSTNNGATFLTSNVIDSGPSNNTAILNNLTPLTSYRIVVGAWNANDAVQSDALVVSTTAPDISDITAVTLTGNGRNQINVAWSGGNNATSYQYYLNGVRQTARLTNGVDNGVSGKNVQLYGTPSNVQYSLVIRAISSTLNLTLDSSAFSFTTAGSSIQNVTNLRTTSVQSTSITIAWTGQGVNLNSGGYAINYYRYSINDGVSFLTNNVTDNGTSNNTAVLTGLTSNTTYKIVVGAWNADDATYSDTLSVTTI